MEEKDNGQTSHCSGNCMNCIPQQRYLCASQISYHNMKMLEAFAAALEELRREVRGLKKTIGDHYPQDVFDPLKEQKIEAQKGDGADKEPQDSLTN